MIQLYRARATFRYFVLRALSVLVLVASTSVGLAQDRNRLDHRGTDFRIAFLPTNGYDDAPRLGLVVWAERPTQGTLYYEDLTGKTKNIRVSTVADTIWLDTFELLMPSPRLQAISKRTLRAVFDDEVTVYAINTMRWSSDSFVALPLDALGTDHVVLSYPNTQRPNPLGDIFEANSDFPSQFAVVGTVNGTRVQITPSARLNNQPNTNSFAVTLDAGEVFLAQAEGPTGTDLTGTRIVADRPIVVYGSHQRTNIPFSQTVGRDHLVEQLPSIDHWQTRAMVSPHYQILKSVPDENIVRVLAAYDNTIVSIDSVRYATLQANQHIELPLDRPKLITSTRPVLVAQYHHSSVDENKISVPNDSIGDPFMLLVPSREQFDSMYKFVSYGTKDFRQHYINVVIPTERLSSVVFDGGIAPWRRLERIPKTSYTFATMEVQPGAHTISARVPFGLYIYGYGPYNSYGHHGGYVVDTLFKDHKEPRISVIDSCIGAIGAAFDDSTFDFGMERIELLPGSRNVALVEQPSSDGDDSIHFRLNLDDPYQDGHAVIKAVDTAGLDATASFDVKGFTVAIVNNQVDPVVIDTLASLNGMSFCRTISLYNYGKFEQRIMRLNIAPMTPGITVGNAMPLIIPPGERRDIVICYQHVGDTAFSVDVGINNGCLDRPIAIVPIVSGIDSTPPEISITTDECRDDVRIQLNELGTFNSGLDHITEIQLVNANMTISTPLPAKSAVLTLTKIDPRSDMIYDIEIVDRVGRVTRVRDTVGGFTVAVYQTPTQVGIRFDEPFKYKNLVYGQMTCDSVTLTNYGLVSLSLGRPRLLGNLDYSIPPQQLPIVLAPGERRRIAVCVTPSMTGRILDTLVLDFNCGTIDERVQLETFVDPLEFGTRDRCGNELSVAVGGLTKRNFLSLPHPNPATGAIATLTFGLSATMPVSMVVYDAQGAIVERLLDRDMIPGGITQIQARVEHYPAGVYFVRMTTPDGALQTERLVIHR